LFPTLAKAGADGGPGEIRAGPSSLSPSAGTWDNQSVFLRKIRVEYEENGQRHACPLKWLDSFSMRNFTNDRVFDDTVPTGEGRLEIGTRVPLEKLRVSMEDWFRRKSYLRRGARLMVTEDDGGE
jgi:hypothetical protein